MKTKLRKFISLDMLGDIYNDSRTFEGEPDSFHLLNINWNKDGEFIKRKGWKSFRGMVYQLKLLNKSYKKMGMQGEFTVKLPLKEK